MNLASLTNHFCEHIFKTSNILFVICLGHWVIERRWENKVVLKNAAYPHLHLIMLNTGLVTVLIDISTSLLIYYLFG